MIEIVVRLGLALVLSLSLALLMAWGWDRSDRVSVNKNIDASIPTISAQPPRDQP